MANLPTRVAVVDDDASVRRALGRFLRASSFETEIYGSGPELLEAFYSFCPHCIVLDLHMEGMTGFDIQRHLSRLASNLPVVIITGHDNERAHDECMALGASAFLSKPVDGQLLVSTIERLVGDARPAC